MCSGSEVGSYLRLIDFLYHLRVIKNNKKKSGPRHQEPERCDSGFKEAITRCPSPVGRPISLPRSGLPTPSHVAPLSLTTFNAQGSWLQGGWGAAARPAPPGTPTLRFRV